MRRFSKKLPLEITIWKNHTQENKHTACDLSSFVNGRHESSENDQYLYRREDCLTKLCDILCDIPLKLINIEHKKDNYYQYRI